MSIQYTDLPLLKLNDGVLINTTSIHSKISGITLMLYVQWPSVYEDYRTAIKSKELVLGMVKQSNISKTFSILNCYCETVFEQHSFDYKAFIVCLEKLNKWALSPNNKDKPIYFPQGIGCGDAGASWDKVVELIDTYLPDGNVFICTHF